MHDYNKYNPLDATISQVEFRESSLDLGVPHPKASMDRMYLLFQRYNTSKDDRLKFSEFIHMICPVNQRSSYQLKQREVRPMTSRNIREHIFQSHTFSQYVKLLEQVIEIEVNMETMRQNLKKRKAFDAGKAFLTMAAGQREAERRCTEAGISPPVAKFIIASDIETLMKKHDHFKDLEEDDISLLMSRFDKDNDGRISINEFFD